MGRKGPIKLSQSRAVNSFVVEQRCWPLTLVGCLSWTLEYGHKLRFTFAVYLSLVKSSQVSSQVSCRIAGCSSQLLPQAFYTNPRSPDKPAKYEYLWQCRPICAASSTEQLGVSSALTNIMFAASVSLSVPGLIHEFSCIRVRTTNLNSNSNSNTTTHQHQR